MKKNEFTEAQQLLEAVKGKELETLERIELSNRLASLIFNLSKAEETKDDQKIQKQMGRMLQDPLGKAWVMQMTDQGFRSHCPSRIMNQISYLMTNLGIPQFIPLWKRLFLKVIQHLGFLAPRLFVPLIQRFMRNETKRIILSGESKPLKKYLDERKRQGYQVNLNRLGESILGEEEAEKRAQLFLSDLEDPSISYISVKISNLTSHMRVLAWDDTLEHVKKRLRELYRAALKNQWMDNEGIRQPKFINLDMEEYRDLSLTCTAFREVLDEPEFLNLSAGIALQSYIPDSFLFQQELTIWAQRRIAAGGAPIKMRIVKGANLAMEVLESHLKGWPQATHLTKGETDAQFIKMVTYGCQPMHAQAVQIGIGSHNLFDIAFAAILRVEKKVEDRIVFEMLEGMSIPQARAVHKLLGPLVLYSPVAKDADFNYAMAYLIRRLDENTSPENFLRHLFDIKPGNEEWNHQVGLFKLSCLQAEEVSSQPRRTQNRLLKAMQVRIEDAFQNEPDTDWTLPQNRLWIEEIFKKGRDSQLKIPLVVAGREVITEQQATLYNASDSKTMVGRHALGQKEHIDFLFESARKSQGVLEWIKTSPQKKAIRVSAVAHAFREKRGELIKAMTLNTAKTVAEGDVEVSEAIDFIEYYARNLLDWMDFQDIEWSPLGTVLVASPWNFPCSIPVGGIAAALLTGNAVIFKPPPEAVWVGWMIAELFWKAGISKEVLQFFPCEDETTGTALIQDPRLDMIILTGATSTARKMLKECKGAKLMAETGGKNCMIITALSDRDLAIKDLLQSAFGHAGQKCSACSLAILEKEVYEDESFLEQLKDAAESLQVGKPCELSTQINPLIHPANGVLLKAFTTLETGEKWLLQPKMMNKEGTLWSPGIKLGVKPGSFTHQTELFGPVLGIMCAASLEQAVEWANGTPYGLTGGLHSLDKREQEYWKRHVEVGNGYINRTLTGAIVRRQPFGGCKASSFGRGAKAGGPNYLTQLMTAKEQDGPSQKAVLQKNLSAFYDWEKSFLDKEEATKWKTALESYQEAWNTHFSIGHDPSNIPGENNLFGYTTRKRLYFRISALDSLQDVLRVMGASGVCECPLVISLDPKVFAQFEKDKLTKWFPLINVRRETEEDFMLFLEGEQFVHVRLLNQLNEKSMKKLAERGASVLLGKVLAQGRLELLNYMREVAWSMDYHRYGNLG